MKRTPALVTAICIIFILAIWGVRSCRQQERPERATESHSEGTRATLTPEEERELERIATLGYVAGTEPVPETTGVLRHEPEAAFEGPTLFTCGEGSEAFLIDMEGTVVHSWSYPGSKGWTRAHAFPNGDLLVITAAPPRLLRLDRDSRLLWQFDEHAHHDLAVLPDNSICVLVRSKATRPGIQDGETLIDDNVVLLDDTGKELAFISLLKAFERSEFGTQWLADHPLPDDPDIFHTNSVEPVFREGRLHLLLSIRSINTVAILDVASGKIVWAIAGRWHKQHEAQFVDGNLLLFDNLGLTWEQSGTEQSRVIEVELGSGELVWSYTEPGLFTRRAGAQQRLPNGNTLVTESEGARIVEVTRDGRIVWEYVNPRTVEGRPDVLLGILRAERLPAGYASEWGNRRDEAHD